MESIRIDLKNSIVVRNGIENTKTDDSRLVLVPCMRILTDRVQVQVPSTTTVLCVGVWGYL